MGLVSIGVDVGPTKDVQFPAQQATSMDQFILTRLSACRVGTEGDGENSDPPTVLDLPAQGQGTHDHFIIRMGRDEKGDR